MSDKKYWLKNGLVFDCEKGLDGYIRGLEVTRYYLGGVHEAVGNVSGAWLDEAHSVKSAGPLTEGEYAAEVAKAKAVTGAAGVEAQGVETVAAGDVGTLEGAGFSEPKAAVG